MNKVEWPRFCMVALGCLGILLTGCAGSGQKTSEPVQPAPTQEEPSQGGGVTMDLTEEQNGMLVALKKGDGIRIVLEGNITTGYGWEVAEVDSKLLTQVGEVKYEQGQSQNKVGAGGNFTLEFKASGIGVSRLKLVYIRPFEKNKPPERVYEVTVDIQ